MGQQAHGSDEPTGDLTQGSASGDYERAGEAARDLQTRGVTTRRVGIVLGTGLGSLAEQVSERIVVPYATIPHFPVSTVAGHAGQLVIGSLQGVPVVAMQGRFHLYEGYTPGQVTFPVRVMRLLGADTLIVTNAAGGLDPSLSAGSLLLLRDHIGLATLAGLNPLAGRNDERWGPRFPSMTGAYDADLRALAHAVAKDLAIALHEGVYAMVSGPNYETPAELHFLQAIGADAVGMSTVPEVLTARHLGMRVLAISCITNAAASDAEAAVEPDHAQVVSVAEVAGGRLAALLSGVLERIQ